MFKEPVKLINKAARKIDKLWFPANLSKENDIKVCDILVKLGDIVSELENIIEGDTND